MTKNNIVFNDNTDVFSNIAKTFSENQTNIYESQMNQLSSTFDSLRPSLDLVEKVTKALDYSSVGSNIAATLATAPRTPNILPEVNFTVPYESSILASLQDVQNNAAKVFSTRNDLYHSELALSFKKIKEMYSFDTVFSDFTVQSNIVDSLNVTETIAKSIKESMASIDIHQMLEATEEQSDEEKPVPYNTYSSTYVLNYLIPVLSMTDQLVYAESYGPEFIFRFVVYTLIPVIITLITLNNKNDEDASSK